MASGAANRETVMVTGASGFIGSCLVRDSSTAAIASTPASSTPTTRRRRTTSTRWRREPARAASACSGATSSTAPRSSTPHGAVRASSTSPPSPCTVDRVDDPQKQLIVPAVQGTLNVLRAAKESGGVRRVVLTSSVSSIVPSPGWPAGEVVDERCWTDIDYCEKNGVWYAASKALAEKAAWKFAEENGLDVVAVNPGTVMGPMIQPTLNASMCMFLRLLEGCTEEYADYFLGPVHVEDVALAHIMVFENPAASGRHICSQSICHWSDFAAKVAELYPNYKVPKFPKDTQPGLVRAEVGSKKLVALGLQFKTMEKIVRDAVESLKSRGHIS